MKYNVLFLILMIISCVFGIWLCHAMENENPLKIKDIICVQHPTEAYFLDQNRIVVGHGKGCSIINSTSDQEINKISTISCSHLVVAQNKVAFSRGREIYLYDDVNKRTWSNKEDYYIYGIAYDAQSLFVCLADSINDRGIMKIYNYGENKHRNNDFDCPINTNFAVNLQKRIVCMARSDILKYDLTNVTLAPKEIKLSFTSFHCIISSNGLLAVKNFHGTIISIINLYKEDYSLNITCKDKYILNMLFYSRGSVLATISRSFDLDLQPQIMSYWDAKTGELISEMPLLNQGTVWSFSFSPGGEKVIIVFGNKCTIYSVPFEVRYKSSLKKEFPFLLCILHKIAEQDQNIPQEIIKLIAHVCFELFRR